MCDSFRFGWNIWVFSRNEATEGYYVELSVSLSVCHCHCFFELLGCWCRVRGIISNDSQSIGQSYSNSISHYISYIILFVTS